MLRFFSGAPQTGTQCQSRTAAPTFTAHASSERSYLVRSYLRSYPGNCLLGLALGIVEGLHELQQRGPFDLFGSEKHIGKVKPEKEKIKGNWNY